MKTKWLLNIQLPENKSSINSQYYALGITGNYITDIVPMRGISRQSLSDGIYADLDGAFVTPGFTDAHIHLKAFAQSISALRLEGMSMREIRRAIREKREEIAPGAWILGRGWERNRLTPGGFPHKRDIDDVAPDVSCALASKDGHSIWLNSRAMEELNIQTLVDEMDERQIIRDSSGRICGIFLESAADMMYRRIPDFPRNTIKEVLRKSIHRLHAKGITAVHCFERFDTLELFQELEREGHLNIRMLFYSEPEAAERLAAARDNMTSRVIRIGGVKLFADGALGTRTAAVSNPYHGEPENFGQLLLSQKEISELCKNARARDLGVAIHAIGDVAVREAVSGMLETISESGSDTCTYRVEHVQIAEPETLEHMRRFGIAASIQPAHLLSDMDMAEKLWADQTGLLYPYRSLIKKGIRVIFGSDAPIEPPEPLLAVRAAVTRRRIDGYPSPSGWLPGEKMSMAQAWKALTQAPAEIEGLKGKRGEISKGQFADIVVFPQNPLDGDIEKIHEFTPIMTVFDGDVVYDPHALARYG